MTAKKIVVTGGSGMIGERVVKKLLEKNYRVRVLVHKSGIESNKKLEMIEGDVGNKKTLEKLVEGCDGLIHLAASLNLNQDAAEVSKVNIDSVKDILEISKLNDLKCLVASTYMVFKGSDGKMRNEKWKKRIGDKRNLYVWSKSAADKLVRETKNNQLITVYPTMVIDKDKLKMKYNTYKGFIGFIWNSFGGGVPGGVMAAIGNKNRRMNLVELDDVAEGIILAWEKGEKGEDYILGGENIPAEKYLEKMGLMLGKKPIKFRIPVWALSWAGKLPEFVPVPKVMRNIGNSVYDDMCFSSEKAVKKLGYSPKWKF